ncbi:MAG: hypothetical protein QY323_04145 [Patescibacteria group bacterium]|nr:MAG: hypothetical protein QY323_04145 [Patescibacteria group bacterium]
MLKKTLLTALFATIAVFGVAARSARAMTISPPDFNLTASPGDVIEDVLHVYNEDPYAITLKPSLLNFTFRPGDETTGSPEFYPAGESRNGHELAEWITLKDDAPFTISPGERVNIPFTLAIPLDAQPGGHFGAIHVGTLQEEQQLEGAKVGVLAATSALIFVRVNGETRDDLAIESFFSSSRYYARLPADFTIRVSNGGTTHLIPVGNIFITDAFGRQVASLEVNGDDKRRVLPGATRRFEKTWVKKNLPKSVPEYVQQWQNFAFGRYSAALVMNYGDSGEQKLLSATTTFWVVPWMVIASILVGLIVLALLLRLLLNRYERRVISRYESRKRQGTS